MFRISFLLFLTLIGNLGCSCSATLSNNTAKGGDAEETEEVLSSSSSSAEFTAKRPNVLFVVCDQLRYDTIQFIQESREDYAAKEKVRTPNLDEFAKSGVWFKTAYCVSPSCAPARATFRTGNTLQRAGILGNKMVKEKVWKSMAIFRDKVKALESFEQVLADKLGYTVEHYGKVSLNMDGVQVKGPCRYSYQLTQ